MTKLFFFLRGARIFGSDFRRKAATSRDNFISLKIRLCHFMLEHLHYNFCLQLNFQVQYTLQCTRHKVGDKNTTAREPTLDQGSTE